MKKAIKLAKRILFIFLFFFFFCFAMIATLVVMTKIGVSFGLIIEALVYFVLSILFFKLLKS